MHRLNSTLISELTCVERLNLYNKGHFQSTSLRVHTGTLPCCSTVSSLIKIAVYTVAGVRAVSVRAVGVNVTVNGTKFTFIDIYGLRGNRRDANPCNNSCLNLFLDTSSSHTTSSYHQHNHLHQNHHHLYYHLKRHPQYIMLSNFLKMPMHS